MHLCSGVLYAAYQRESIEKALYYGAITAACSLLKKIVPLRCYGLERNEIIL